MKLAAALVFTLVMPQPAPSQSGVSNAPSPVMTAAGVADPLAKNARSAHRRWWVNTDWKNADEKGFVGGHTVGHMMTVSFNLIEFQERKAVTAITLEDYLRAQLRTHTERTKEQLTAAKRGRVNPRLRNTIVTNGIYAFNSNIAKGAEIDRLQNELEHPKNLGLPVIEIPAPQQLEIGTLNQDKTKYRVVKMMDETHAIVSATAILPGTQGVLPPSLATWTFCIHASVVKELHENQELTQFSGVFQIRGFESYRAGVGAARLLDVVEPYDLTPHIEKLLKEIL